MAFTVTTIPAAYFPSAGSGGSNCTLPWDGGSNVTVKEFACAWRLPQQARTISPTIKTVLVARIIVGKFYARISTINPKTQETEMKTRHVALVGFGVILGAGFACAQTQPPTSGPAGGGSPAGPLVGGCVCDK